MIPSTAPPFAMTRWVAQTHQNYVSQLPYNWTADTIHGFQGTRQPAIWMGESAPITVIPGVTRNATSNDPKLKTKFEERGMKMRKDTEIITPSYYSVVLEDGAGGHILVEQSASKRAPCSIPYNANNGFQPPEWDTSDSHLV
jgi:putative alpha-1,2-mannosidase